MYMRGCQNHGPSLDPYYNTAPKIWGTHNHHNFDNHPYTWRDGVSAK